MRHRRRSSVVAALPRPGRDRAHPHQPGQGHDAGGGGPPRAPASCVRLVEHPERFLNPSCSWCCSCHLVAAALRRHPRRAALRRASGVAVAIVVEVVVIFVLAEAAPKTWAVQHPERAALLVGARSSPPSSRFPPLRLLARGLIGLTNVILPGKGLKQGPFVSEEELLALADVAAEEDVIEREERALIHSIIEFGDTVVREVMVPRPDMVTVEARRHGRRRRWRSRSPPATAASRSTSRASTTSSASSTPRTSCAPSATGTGDEPVRDARARGRLRARDQAGRRAAARDAGGEVPHGDRRRRVRRHRRPGHARGPDRGAGRRDRRRVRRRGAADRAAARRRRPGQRPHADRRGQRAARRRPARGRLGHGRRARVQPARPRAGRGRDASSVDGHRLRAEQVQGRRIGRVRITPARDRRPHSRAASA